MISHDRRTFLKTLTLAGAAVFTAHHLRAIDQDLTNPKDPKIVVGPYRKTWETLYAEQESDDYRLTLGAFASELNEQGGMSWREVIEHRNDEGHIKMLEQLHALDLDGEWDDALGYSCEDEASLEAYAKATGKTLSDEDLPTWEEVWKVTNPSIVEYFENNSSNGYPRYLSEIDDECREWYDYVGPMHTPEGKAYQEIIDILDAVDQEDYDLGEAARNCVKIIEGSGPGCDFHGVYVKSREDLGILRRILHASGQKVNILVR